MTQMKPSAMNMAAVAIIVILVLGIGIFLFLNPPPCNLESCPHCPGISNKSMCAPCPVCEPRKNVTETQIETGGLSLIYLEPINCSDCDRSMMDDISQRLGIGITMYETDSVPRPSMLVSVGNRTTLIVATSRFNIMNAICRITGNKKSCDSCVGDLLEVNRCLDDYNISPDTVLFLYMENSIYSKTMMSWLEDLEEKGYKFLWLNIENKTDIKIAKDCLINVFDLEGYFPQFVCPRTGEHKTGAFEKRVKLREFVDRCENVTRNTTQ